MHKLYLSLAALLLALPATHAAAQNYPTKPIRMMVPFAPGGTGEFLSRSITPRMGELIGQQFIVDFRGGAGTTLAAGLVASAPADGYTVLIQTVTTQAINHSLYSKLSYDTRKDFASAGLIAVIPVVLAAHPSLPARNAKELAALTHTRAGKIDFASPGIGTASHFGIELFKHHFAEAAHRLRQAARHSHRQRATLRGRAATGDVCRVRLSRIRSEFVVGHPGAGAHAAGRHRPAEQ